MRWLKEKLKKAMVIYDCAGWQGLTRAIANKMLRMKHQGVYLPRGKTTSYYNRRERKIFYIDYFSHHNSNPYWLKTFRKFGRVEAFDIIRENRGLLEEWIMKVKPHHIHLGGSVKNNMVPPKLLYNVKRKLGCTISVFYGDGIYSLYHSELAKVVDCIYISNKTHIKINGEKGLKNFKYMPCPTDPHVSKHYKSPKVYDVLFIGNNNQVSRLPLLKKLAELFNLKVFGSGWEKIGLNFGDAVYGKEFSKVCSKAKINIGILDIRWTNLEAYFSSRLINTLATGSFYIQCYTPGLERVFTNRKHLVWYTGENELIELIKYYLMNEKEREEIAAEGQREVYQNYTYERSVKRILGEAEQNGRLRLHLGCGSVHLDGYVNIDIQNWAGACDLITDIRDLSVFGDNSVSHIFNHAVLEHIPPWDTVRTLREWNRVLKPGGTIQIEVPDLERVFQHWLIDKTLSEEEAINNIYGGFKSPDKAYSRQDHLTGFTYDRLTRMMRDCGFTNFERLEHPKYHHILVVWAQKAVA